MRTASCELGRDAGAHRRAMTMNLVRDGTKDLPELAVIVVRAELSVEAFSFTLGKPHGQRHAPA